MSPQPHSDGFAYILRTVQTHDVILAAHLSTYKLSQPILDEELSDSRR